MRDSHKENLELAARAAGAVLKEYFETSLSIEVKKDKSFVTEADKKAEEAIFNVIKNAFPDYGIVSEEEGEIVGTSEWNFIIDPLDGTANFLNGIPLWCTSIALLKNDEIRYAAIFNPVMETFFFAERNKGAFWNGHKMRVSDEYEKNVIVTFGKSGKKDDVARLNALFQAVHRSGFRVRYLGSAALELAYLARGGTEGFINLGTKPWDFSAGVLLAREAGAQFTDFAGNDWDGEERYFVVTNGKIHNSLLGLIKSVDE